MPTEPNEAQSTPPAPAPAPPPATRQVTLPQLAGECNDLILQVIKRYRLDLPNSLDPKKMSKPQLREFATSGKADIIALIKMLQTTWEVLNHVAMKTSTPEPQRITPPAPGELAALLRTRG